MISCIINAYDYNLGASMTLNRNVASAFC